MIGHASEWVQLCERTCLGDLLNMHKRDLRGKLGFYRYDQWGLLALLTRFDNGVFNEGGGLRFQLHVYRANNQTRNKYTCNAQAHDQYCNVMFMVALCGQFHLKGVYCI